ncbi:hypothetical protein MLD38_004825 [Melastoma candidum]|uniref:Uncharacterized protein n=1 Tax=Melastoma candidum TaxID=119954 RepID=A0ACB9S6U9_9MYRT|nr:hypothetical protein MLD38_004825 [Melastoma candidum]
MVWAHSTSTNLVDWSPHPIAIQPSQPSDINGCWSGSTTILRGGRPAILYTGINPHNQQVQNLAEPKNYSDPFLIEWVKSPGNPLMTPTNMINPSSFRDPTTAWLGSDGRWRVIVGSQRNARGMAILYRSKNFVNWVKAKHTLHSKNGTGMWECPDFYPVSKVPVGLDTSDNGPTLKHILKVSLDDTNHDQYTIGNYNEVKDVYVPDEGQIEGTGGLRYDYGKFYASKTFFDSEKKRRILWGWVNESSSTESDVKKGWSGVQVIPRTVWLDASEKQLLQWPIPEVEYLRTNKVELSQQVLKPGTTLVVNGISAAQADVESFFVVTNLDKAEAFDPKWTDPQILCSQKGASVKGTLGPFGLLVLASKGLEEYTAVFFRVFKGQNKYVVLMCSDQSRSSLDNTNDKTTYGAFVDVDPVQGMLSLSLRSLIDHSIVESFGGRGKVCITARVYPTQAIEGSAHLLVFNSGTEGVQLTKINAWSMKKAQIN